MPVSTQILKCDESRDIQFELEDIRGQNVRVHSLRFISTQKISVHMIFETMDGTIVFNYHMNSKIIQRMGYSSNWLQMFNLPVQLPGERTVSEMTVFLSDYDNTDDITCIYAWRPCDEVGQHKYKCDIYGGNRGLGNHYVSLTEPFQEDWLTTSCDVVKRTPWYWIIASPACLIDDLEGPIYELVIYQD